MNIRLHLLAVPFTITRDEYSHCAYTGKVKRFSPMMRSRGIETSESGATKDIEIMTKAKWSEYRIKTYQYIYPDISLEEATKKHNDINELVGPLWNLSSPLIIEFNNRLKIKLKENYRSRVTDIVCLPLGRTHDAALNGFNYLQIETGIGYTPSYKDFRVFESYSWMSNTLGIEDKLPHNYWFVIPNYFNINEFKLSMNPNPIKIGFLGRLTRLKGCGIVAEIAKKFPKIQFVLCGGGDPTPFLTSTNITYSPPVHGEKRSEYLGSCTAVLCLSGFLEPFCGVSVEAQLCGTPVISSDHGAFVDNIEQFKTGLRGHTLADYCYGVQMALDGKFDRKYIRERAVKLFDMYKLAYNYEYVFKSVLDIYNGKNGWYSPDTHIKSLSIHDKTRFCIVLAGQMRTYDSLFIKNSYIHYLSKYENIDLYIYTWKNRGCSNRHNNPDRNIKENDIMTEEEIRKYYSQFSFFNIKEIIIDDFNKFYEGLDENMKIIYNTPDTHSPVTIAVPIQYKYQQAAQSLKKYNTDYSYCMILRPDFYFINEIPHFGDIKNNTIYFKHWHLRCIDHGWFGTGSTIIKQLENIYTNIPINISNIKEHPHNNNEIILENTRANNINLKVLDGNLIKQIQYCEILILNNHKLIDNYVYKSNTDSIELLINNNEINFKKVVLNKMPFSWFGYNINKGNYKLTFSIISSIDIDFPFIKSHNPVIFYKTNYIAKNIETTLSIDLSIENNTDLIFIFDNYNNYCDITFKNIKFN